VNEGNPRKGLYGVPASGMRIVDLTIPISEGMDAFPGEPSAHFSPFSVHAEGGIEMWNVEIFSQLGTHVDAPSHFIQGGLTSNQLDLESMIGEACVIDIGGSSGHVVTVAELTPFSDAITSSRRVLLRSGWSSKVGTEAYWSDFPVLSLEVARFLTERGVRFLGMDTPTPSVVELHEVHEELLSGGCIIAECLVNLGELAADHTFLVCLPLKLVGLDGAPSRIVALEWA
jgi:arylformamidase